MMFFVFLFNCDPDFGFLEDLGFTKNNVVLSERRIIGEQRTLVFFLRDLHIKGTSKLLRRLNNFWGLFPAIPGKVNVSVTYRPATGSLETCLIDWS
jgi:hypothetical protein